MKKSMSRYKKRKLVGAIVSVLLVALGVGLFKLSSMPTLGIPFIIFFSFSTLYFVTYFLFEFEEDEAGSSGLLNLNAGRIDQHDNYRVK